ncbi:hypothetical protein Bca101_097316 [Brassica carinata]
MPPRQARRGGDYLPIPISSSSESSPPSTPAPLPTPSFEATPLGSSFETDPSEGSYDQTPVHMPFANRARVQNIVTKTIDRADTF